MYLLRLLPVVAFLAIVGTSSTAPTESYPPPKIDPCFVSPGHTCSVKNGSELISGTRSRRNSPIGTVLWKNRTLRYFFDEKDYAENGNEMQQRRRRIFLAGLKRIVDFTCINAVESTTKPTVFVSDRREKGICGSSWIGVMENINQYVNVQCWNDPFATIHELIHALGMDHTQERPDRDQYIIVPNGIGKNNDAELFVPYDYSSIMHYPDFTPTDPDYRFTVGSTFPSFFDILSLNLMYKCQELCPTESSAKCKNGGYPKPKNCQVCNCPLGYGGPLCDRRPAGCGNTLEATDNWQPLTWKVIAPSEWKEGHIEEYIEPGYSMCTHWIQAPEGQNVEVRIVDIQGQGCMQRKNHENVTYASPRYCSGNFMHSKPVKSPQNLMPVVTWTVGDATVFSIEYRIYPVAEQVKETAAGLLKNFNICLQSTEQSTRDKAILDIFTAFKKLPTGKLREANSILECIDNEGERRWRSHNAVSSDATFSTNSILQYIVGTKATSLEILDEQIRKTTVNTKWSFNQGEKKMICDISLDFGEDHEKKTTIQRIHINCPHCAIP